MLQAGVIGCGHLGKFHIKQLSESKRYQLAGVYDKNLDIAKVVSKEFNCDFFKNSNDLINKSDVICIVTPTPFHFEYAKECIASNVHVFIEKPVCDSLKDSKELIQLNKKRNLKIQVGHVERFNPAFTAIKNKINNPMFIESHRLAQFNPRGTDVSVVLDLMIHDLDIILSSVNSEIKKISSSVIKVDGKNCLAPMVLNKSIPDLIAAAKENGVAVLAITNSHHMAAMWPETEMIAEQGLVAFACTSYKPAVAPAGAKKPLFGTNPISFAWPRPGMTPVVYDMATASMAMGEVQVAKREGHKVPLGTGLSKEGKETTDPAEIADGGVLLPFGGYKGSGIAMMVELLAGALVGDNFSYETAAKDNNDGGPPSGGEFILAMSPDKISEKNWNEHSKNFFEKMKGLEGVRLPGERRHKNRLNTGLREINKEMLQKVRDLL